MYLYIDGLCFLRFYEDIRRIVENQGTHNLKLLYNFSYIIIPRKLRKINNELCNHLFVTGFFCLFWIFVHFCLFAFYWSITALQYYVNFSCITKWISYIYTHRSPLPFGPPSLPSRSSSFISSHEGLSTFSIMSKEIVFRHKLIVFLGPTWFSSSGYVHFFKAQLVITYNSFADGCVMWLLRAFLYQCLPPIGGWSLLLH